MSYLFDIWLSARINDFAHLGSMSISDWMDSYIEMIDVLEAKGIAASSYCSDNPSHGLQLRE